MGVEILGFSVEQDHPDYVSPEVFTEITGWVSGVKLAGEIEEDKIPDLGGYKFDILQVKDPSLLESARQLAEETILKIDLDQVTDFGQLNELLSGNSGSATWFLLESASHEMNTELFSTISHISSNHPILLGFGIQKETVTSILEKIPVSGLVLKGGHEQRPGYKDYEELADILEEIEVDD